MQPQSQRDNLIFGKATSIKAVTLTQGKENNYTKEQREKLGKG